MKNYLVLLIFSIISCTNSPLNTTYNASKELAFTEQLKALDLPLTKAKKGDWLYEYPEKEQTFEAFKALKSVKPMIL